MRNFGKTILVLVVLITAGGAAISFLPKGLIAQTSDFTPNPDTVETTPPDIYKNLDIEKIAFSNDKKGCAMRTSFFYAVAKRYERGDQIEDFTDMKIMQPLFEERLSTIREKGLIQAKLDSLKDYDECIKLMPLNTNPEREYDYKMKYGMCAQLNSILLDTLEAVEDRRDINIILDKYDNTDIDFSETRYFELNDPVPLFIGRIYKAAQNGGQDAAIDLASSVTLGCMN